MQDWLLASFEKSVLGPFHVHIRRKMKLRLLLPAFLLDCQSAKTTLLWAHQSACPSKTTFPGFPSSRTQDSSGLPRTMLEWTSTRIVEHIRGHKSIDKLPHHVICNTSIELTALFMLSRILRAYLQIHFDRPGPKHHIESCIVGYSLGIIHLRIYDLWL